MTLQTITLPEEVNALSPASKVWIYQSSRPFTDDELPALSAQLKTFAQQWTAHNKQLQAAGFILLNRILVLMVDESHTTASGCSIDTSVHFMQSIEKQYGVTVFDRMLVNYLDQDTWHTTTLHALREKLEAGAITDQTLVVNPLVQTKSAFMEGLIVPASACWIGDFLR